MIKKILRKISWLLPHDLKRNLYKILFPGRFRAIQKMRSDLGAYSYRSFDKHQCIFVHIPKTAGVAVSKSLFDNLAGAHGNVMLYRLVFSKREFDSYFKFAIVRNPWDRLVSAFFFLKSGGFNEGDKAWSETYLKPYPDFKSFVLNGLSKKEILSFKHFKPQNKYIAHPITKKLLVDFVGRYERLSDDFSVIAKKLNIDASLIEANRGSSRTGSYKDYYDEKLVAIVRKAYADDIKIFKYDFE